MQRLFSMFPQGGPGVALLLLRIAVATAFLMNVGNLRGAASTPFVLAGAVLTCLVVASLSLGFLTPFLAAVAAATAAASLLLDTGSANTVQLIRILSATALALLGPGAYSVDARLFGRRVTVVPPRNTAR